MFDEFSRRMVKDPVEETTGGAGPMPPIVAKSVSLENAGIVRKVSKVSNAPFI